MKINNWVQYKGSEKEIFNFYLKGFRIAIHFFWIINGTDSSFFSQRKVNDNYCDHANNTPGYFYSHHHNGPTFHHQNRRKITFRLLKSFIFFREFNSLSAYLFSRHFVIFPGFSFLHISLGKLLFRDLINTVRLQELVRLDRRHTLHRQASLQFSHHVH